MSKFLVSEALDKFRVHRSWKTLAQIPKTNSHFLSRTPLFISLSPLSQRSSPLFPNPLSPLLFFDYLSFTLNHTSFLSYSISLLLSLPLFNSFLPTIVPLLSSFSCLLNFRSPTTSSLQLSITLSHTPLHFSLFHALISSLLP